MTCEIMLKTNRKAEIVTLKGYIRAGLLKAVLWGLLDIKDCGVNIVVDFTSATGDADALFEILLKARAELQEKKGDIVLVGLSDEWKDIIGKSFWAFNSEKNALDVLRTGGLIKI